MRGLADPADAAWTPRRGDLAVGMLLFFNGMEEDVLNIMSHPSVSFITGRASGRGAPPEEPTEPIPVFSADT